MAFMRAYIEPVSGWDIDTNLGGQFVSDDTVCPNQSDIDSALAEMDETGNSAALLALFRDGLEPGTREVFSAEWREGWESGVSAPGYMDQSECGVFDSKAEAAAECISMFYDQPLVDMDEGELEDLRWLAELADDSVLLGELDEFETEEA